MYLIPYLSNLKYLIRISALCCIHLMGHTPSHSFWRRERCVDRMFDVIITAVTRTVSFIPSKLAVSESHSLQSSLAAL